MTISLADFPLLHFIQAAAAPKKKKADLLLQSMSSLGKNEGIFFLTLLSDPPFAN